MFKKLQSFFFRNKDTEPEAAYDRWATDYDDQPRNLMLQLDEQIFSGLLQDLDIKDLTVTDIGCGSGRHWKKIWDKGPKQLTGYDVSAEMLLLLQKKFPGSTVYKINGNKLEHSPDESVQLIISTLTLAHIENLPDALSEWNRVLQPGGHIIITDFHPLALQKGAKRSFKHKNKMFTVKNFIHSIDEIQIISGQLQWQVVRLEERMIDENVKSWFDEQDARAAFQSFKGTPVIYGLLLKKSDAD